VFFFVCHVGQGVSFNSINCNKLIVFNSFFFFLPFCDLKIIIRIPQIYKEKGEKVNTGSSTIEQSQRSSISWG
jgi:hypothetical protein